MVENEARLIRTTLASLLERGVIEHGNSVVNLGSQSLDFRERIQPHVGELLRFASQLVGGTVTNVDLQSDPGVDLCLDLMTQEGMKIALDSGKVVFVMNLLEHLEDPAEFCHQLTQMRSDSEHIFVLSGPSVFPYHPDPIDNGFRPSQQEHVELLFPGCNLLSFETVRDYHYLKHAIRSGIFGVLRGVAGATISLIRCLSSRSTAPLVGWVFPAIAFVAVISPVNP